MPDPYHSGGQEKVRRWRSIEKDDMGTLNKAARRGLTDVATPPGNRYGTLG
jgi:hypothetical protein